MNDKPSTAHSLWALAAVFGFGALATKLVSIWTDGRVSERFAATMGVLLFVTVVLAILGALAYFALRAKDEPVPMDELEDLDYEDDEGDWREQADIDAVDKFRRR